jgi:octaprenyl-diphosphate synthase
MSLADIRQRVEPDLQAVDAVIRRELHSDVVLVRQVAEYIIHSGGKRLRPLLTVLAARALGYEGVHHHTLAAVVEFIHTATLLHDDVVDKSEMRRGRKTANELFGNAASVLVGDFVYSRSFQMMVSVQNMRVMEVLSDATNVIAEGEVLQLLNCHDPEVDEERYLQVIRYKTAKLFEASTRLGAVLCQCSPAVEEAMARYGAHLGTAFQMVDDVLDYSGDLGETGKNLGDDLAEGKATLPLIYVMKHGSPKQAQIIRHAIENGAVEEMDQVVSIIRESQALDYTVACARREAELACAAIHDCLPATQWRDDLEELARLAVERSQ